MATHTSTVPDVLDALKALLDARKATPGSPLAANPATDLEETVITTAATGEPVPKQSIQFFGTGGDQEWAAIGNRRRRETYTIRGGIFVVYGGTIGDGVADIARNRVYTLLAELEDAIRVSPTLGLPDRVIVQLARADLDQGAQDNGRWAALDIDLAVTAELVST